MSSVQSFLRQRATGNTILSAPAAAANTYFAFVAGSGNFVGNYPPGYMVPVTPTIPSNAVLRDMGKTIKAGVASSVGAAIGAEGFFREVQILQPSVVASPTASTSFGVIGNLPGLLPAAGNAGDSGYSTFYLPILVEGVAPGAAGSTTAPLTTTSAALVLGAQL
jgi:hypothetical protein